MNSESSGKPQEDFGEKYKILRRLAVGGMAEIYLAESAQMHGFRKKVVIKRILPQYADDAHYVDMFLDEARLVARLNHPSIVQVFDIGQHAEGVFFTMEYVEGQDLAEVLGACYKQKREMSLEEVLAIAVPMAEALHHSHELRDDDGQLVNLVHRDVSPSNIIVTNEGQIKLLDFGVAKSKSQLRPTTGVSLKGKFGYMSPEHCQGLDLDRRSDIFSYGVVLWELITGRRLFPGGNEPSVLMRIMEGQFSAPSTLRPLLPPRLDDICLRALAKDRDQRYATLQDLLTDLDEFSKTSGIVTTSRILSTMLSDIFPGQKNGKRPEKSTVRLSLPLKASTPQSISVRKSSFAPMLSGNEQTMLAGSPDHWNPNTGQDGENLYPEISVGQSAEFEPAGSQPVTQRRRRIPLLIGGAIVLLGAIALAISVVGSGDTTDTNSGELVIPNAAQFEPIPTSVGVPPAKTPNSENPIPEDIVIAPDEEETKSPDEEDIASTPGEEAASTPGEEAASTPEKENAKSPNGKKSKTKTRKKTTVKTLRKNPKKDKKDKNPKKKVPWDPNSPLPPQ